MDPETGLKEYHEHAALQDVVRGQIVIAVEKIGSSIFRASLSYESLWTCCKQLQSDMHGLNPPFLIVE